MLNDTKKEESHKISFIVPCYNEEKLVGELLDQLMRVAKNLPYPFEIIVVNDGSTDKTQHMLDQYIHEPSIHIIHHQQNKGKGASIRSGLDVHTGNIVIIQDSDHEYDPNDLPSLIAPLIENRADVVYGSRFLGGKPRRALYFTHALGNKLLTTLTNILTGLTLTDMETGYKAMRSTILSSLKIEENRFGVEPELTMKLAKIKDIRFYEVGISYYGRSFKEGKKIRWTDGVYALLCILKYRFK